MPDPIPIANVPPGVQYGHATPDMSTQVMHAQQMQQQLEMGKLAMRTDRQVQGLVAAMSMYMHGGDRAAATNFLTKTDAGKLLRDAIGLAGAGGMLGGGSPVSMMHGMQQFVSGSHAQVAGTPVMGAGSLTNKIAEGLYLQMQKSVYDKITGSPDTRITHGLNRTQVGETFALMGATGAMQGMNAGQQMQLRNGKYQFKEDPKVFSKVKEEFEKYARFLGTVRDVFGDRSVAELYKLAESSTGLSAGTHSPAEISRRLERLRSIASTTGLSEQHVMGAASGITDRLSGLMGRPAAGMAAQEIAYGMAIGGGGFKELRERMRDRGFNMAVPDQDMIQQQRMSAQVALNNEPGMREAYAALSSFGDAMTPQARSGLNAALTAYETEGDVSKLDARRAGVMTALQKSGMAGMLFNMSEEAKERMIASSPSMMRRRAEANTAADGARNRQMLQEGVWQAYAGDADGSMTQMFGAGAAGIQNVTDTLFDFTDILDHGTQGKLMGAWRKGEKVDSATLEKAKKQFIEAGHKTEAQWRNSMIRKLSEDPNAQMGGELDAVFQTAVNHGFVNATPAAARQAAAIKEIADATMNMGSSPAMGVGGISGLLEGMLKSNGQITAADAIRVTKAVGKYAPGVSDDNITSFTLKNGAITANAENLLKQNKSSGGALFAALGVTGDDTAAADEAVKALKDPTKQAAYLRHLQEYGAVSVNRKTGEALVMDKAAIEKTLPYIERIKNEHDAMMMSGDPMAKRYKFGDITKDSPYWKQLEARVEKNKAAGMYDAPEDRIQKARDGAGAMDAQKVLQMHAAEMLIPNEGMLAQYTDKPTAVDTVGIMGLDGKRRYMTDTQFNKLDETKIGTLEAFLIADDNKILNNSSLPAGVRAEAAARQVARGAEFTPSGYVMPGDIKDKIRGADVPGGSATWRAQSLRSQAKALEEKIESLPAGSEKERASLTTQLEALNAQAAQYEDLPSADAEKAARLKNDMENRKRVADIVNAPDKDLVAGRKSVWESASGWDKFRAYARDTMLWGDDVAALKEEKYATDRQILNPQAQANVKNTALVKLAQDPKKLEEFIQSVKASGGIGEVAKKYQKIAVDSLAESEERKEKGDATGASAHSTYGTAAQNIFEKLKAAQTADAPGSPANAGNNFTGELRITNFNEAMLTIAGLVLNKSK